MSKFKMKYSSALGDSATLTQVVNELASQTGVQFEGSLPAYNVKKLEGFSCREVLGYIASLCGGNAIIKRNGNFTIVYPTDINRDIGEGIFDFTREEVKYKIGKITCQVSDSEILSKGSLGTDSMELQFENPWMNATILTDIYNRLNGFEYLGYKIKWQGDPSLDIGDIITYKDDKGVIRKLPIFNRKLSYDGGLDSELSAKGETKNENSSDSSGSMSKKVNRVVTDLAIVNEALIGKANVQELEAANAKIENLEVKTAKIEEAIIGVAHIEDLNAINANIEKLIAADATINNALINKANITDLVATNIKFEVASGGTLDLQTLLSKHITGENGQFINISSDNTVIANAVIKDAMIENISVSKLLAGDISATKFRIVSDTGNMLIYDNTIQIRDNNRVRVQIGKDASNDYNMYVWDSAGKLMFDATGLKADGIKNKIIRDDMISDNANIDGAKLNISSLITEINKDTNTTVIKSTKVQIDSLNQTLDVAFNSLKSNVDSKESRNLFIEKNTVDGYYSDTGFVEASGYRTSDYIEVNKGEIYTLCKFATDGYHRVVIFDKDKNRVGTRLVSKDTILKYTIPSNIKYIRLSIEKSLKYKIEKGENPNPIWASAPEDVEEKIESNTTAISVAQGKIDGLISENTIIKGDVTTISDKYTSLKATVDGINTTVASHTSSIGSINTNISGLSGKVTTVENKYTSLSQDLSGFKTTVANNYSTKTELSTVDGKVTGLTSRVSTAESSISQLNNKIALKVEQTDITNAINNMDIGVSNLLKGTSKELKSVTFGGWDYYFPNNLTSWEKNKKLTGRIFLKPTNQEASCMLHVRYTDGTYKQYRGNIISAGSEGYSKVTITVPDRNDISHIQFSIRHSASSTPSDTVYYKEAKVEKGDKATDWSPASEDVDSSVANVQTQVTTTSNKVATIETNLSSITQRVSATETKVTTVTNDLNNMQIGVRNLVKNSPTLNNSYNQLNTFKGTRTILNDSSAKSGKVVKIECTTAGTGFYCILWSGDDSCVGKKFTWSFYAKMNKTKTLSKVGHERGGITSISVTTEWKKFTYTWTYSSSGNRAFIFYPDFIIGDIIYIKDLKIEEGNKSTDWTAAPEDVDSAITAVDTKITTTNNKVSSIETNLSSITSRVSSTESKITTINGNVTSLQSRVTTAEQKITPTAITTTISSAISGGTSSISTTQFVMDKNGLIIKNGALTIKNKAGTTVFQGDTNGNLVFTGTAKSQNGAQWVSLDSGGVTFQDSQRNEQMLRIGLSYFSSARDMNGVALAMPQYSDFLRIQHIAKADLTNGWTASDTQYNFMDFWSGDQTVDGVAYKKGVNVYAPMYINNRIKFKYSGSTTYTNDILSAEWNTINGLLGLYGDNGAILGYQSGSNLNARIVVTEGAHPGTGDQIKIWGNLNCSGYTVHNATFSGKFVNSYANEVTRTFTETHCIEAENKQVRINFTDIQLVDGKAILNIPKAYIGINTGYIINSIVKKGKGDIWVLEEQENRFVIEGTADIKVNIEVIINLDNVSPYSVKSINDTQLCIDMTTGQPIGA